jgi:sugar phosphate permease
MNDTTRDREAPSAYPWLIAFVGMFALFLSNGMTATGITIFDPSLLDEFGWSRADFKLRDLLNFVMVALFSPIFGILIDRWNPKYLLMTGCGLLTLGYFGYSMIANGAPVPLIEAIAVLTFVSFAALLAFACRQVWPSLPLAALVGLTVVFAAAALWFYFQNWSGIALKQVYVIHLLFALALGCSGSMVVIFLVSSWFVKNRGLAIGIALVGTSMGSAVLPLVNPYLIQSLGWRQAYVYNAFMPVVLFLVVLILVKGTPAHAGTLARGQNTAIGDLKQHGLTFREAIRTRTFWAIGVSGFLTYFSIFAFVQHLVLHLNKTFGYALQEAGKTMFFFSVVAMIAKFAIGALADKVDRHRVFTVCQVIMLIGVVGLATMKREWVFGAALIIGVGWGGLFTLYNMLAVNNFGLREIGRINGSISLLESVGVGIGSWSAGWLFDKYGNYQVAFEMIAVAVLIAIVIGTQIRSEVDERVLAKA